MGENGMRIGELARLVGISTSALRYSERAGLVGAAARTEAGYRTYGPDTAGRVEFLLRAKALGLSLQEVRKLLAGPRADTAAERDRLRHVVAHKISETADRIAQLEALHRELRSLYVRLLRAPGPECGHVGDCACWLPTAEEAKIMTQEVACCGQLCCPDCACTSGAPCDCPDCLCHSQDDVQRAEGVAAEYARKSAAPAM
jgi:MerR family transcriptional regulator, copper efflux regulator